MEVEDKIEKALKKDKEAKEAIAETKKAAKDTSEKDTEKSECSDKNQDLKDVSAKPSNSSKMEKHSTMVTPPPSIEKTKDNSKML